MTYSVISGSLRCGHHHQSVPTAENCANKLMNTPKWKDMKLSIKDNFTGEVDPIVTVDEVRAMREEAEEALRKLAIHVVK